jgi:hypothetical protein
MAIRPLRGRAVRLFSIAALLVSPLLAAVVAPSPASAAATRFFLVRTNSYTSHPAAGAIHCQTRDVTLPKLSSSNRYAWSEVFPQENSEGLTNYHQTFSGKFFWSVCISSMKGLSNAYAWREYSMLTGETAACENTGHCTTYTLENHFLPTGGTNAEWGSELFVVPASECSFETCESTGTVTVTKS